jgi:hypothetical protein
MSGLQGESTLTDAEKVTEARRHVNALEDSFYQMTQGERTFVEQLAQRFEHFGEKTAISNKQLFWLRDLVAKY